jgi:FG-GAP repeat
VDPLVQLAELTASDGVSGNLLGISVGISGDTTFPS